MRESNSRSCLHSYFPKTFDCILNFKNFIHCEYINFVKIFFSISWGQGKRYDDDIKAALWGNRLQDGWNLLRVVSDVRLHAEPLGSAARGIVNFVFPVYYISTLDSMYRGTFCNISKQWLSVNKYVCTILACVQHIHFKHRSFWFRRSKDIRHMHSH